MDYLDECEYKTLEKLTHPPLPLLLFFVDIKILFLLHQNYHSNILVQQIDEMKPLMLLFHNAKNENHHLQEYVLILYHVIKIFYYLKLQMLLNIHLHKV